MPFKVDFIFQQAQLGGWGAGVMEEVKLDTTAICWMVGGTSARRSRGCLLDLEDQEENKTQS